MSEPHRAPRLNTVFDRAAESYGRVGPDLSERLGGLLLRHVNLRGDETVLDVAAGTGASALPAARTVDTRGLVVAVDLSRAMLSQLEQEASRNGLRSLVLVQMDAQALAFPDEAFDAIVCGLALDSFADKVAALEELGRVLKPGGCLTLSVAPRWWWEQDERWQWHQGVVRALDIDIFGGDRSLGDPDELAALLQTTGFRDPHATRYEIDLRFGDEQEWWTWAWSHGYRRVLEAMNQHQLDEYKTVCFDHLRHRPPGTPILGKLAATVAVAVNPPSRLVLGGDN
jgi:ubiquinone/menaquinone biosynthesis C-methylase UbiE